MRYYCPECKREVVTINPEVVHCECQHTARLLAIPQLETPTQYEKRTGKKLSDKAAVWMKVERYTGYTIVPYKNCKKGKYYYYGNDLEVVTILCANSPEPPPDDYAPEVEA